MKTLLKDYGFVQIHEEQIDGRVIISASDSSFSQILVAYTLNAVNVNKQKMFRNIAMNYFHEIRGRFGNN